MQKPVRLSHRSILSVTGPDAAPFLNGILTCSTLQLAPDAYRYGALLTPQGKVIADMLLAAEGDAILIDTATLAAAPVLKRLTLMKLRAAVTIAQRPDLGVTVFAGAPDPRSPAAPHRLIAPHTEDRDDDAYHRARIAAGLPEQGCDFGVEEVFPADINMDLVDGVDFKKGCFVGQEVASRMKRRGTARRRTLKAELAQGLTAPTPLLADGFEIGVLTSFSGGDALARVRIDRMAEAKAAGHRFTADGQEVRLDTPGWLAGELAAMAEAKEARGG